MNTTELEYLLTLRSVSADDKRELVVRHVRTALTEGAGQRGVRLTPLMAAALVGVDAQYVLDGVVATKAIIEAKATPIPAAAGVANG